MACAASPGAMEVARGARCAGGDLRPPRLGRRLDVRGRSRARPAVGPRWTVARRGERVVDVDTNMPGIYNHENLVGMIAVASGLGVELPAIAQAVRGFLGVRRRQEVRGVARGVTVVDDFAHHPTAIRETMLALKGRHGPGKLIAAFEPRSATSRRNVFQDAVRGRAVGGRRGRAGAAVRAREGAGRPSAWTSSAWPPICAARTCRRGSSRRSTRPSSTWRRALRRATPSS